MVRVSRTTVGSSSSADGGEFGPVPDRGVPWHRAEMEQSPGFVIVEGDSDAAAIRTLAARLGRDLQAEGVSVRSAHGVTNFTRTVDQLRRRHPGARLSGLYDEADERHVRRALGLAEVDVPRRSDIEALGFFVCVSDLEDELIRALGTEAVESVLDENDELRSFRRFQAQPQHRDGATSQQLRRFLGTRATRKIRYGRLLVEALDLGRVPVPLSRILDVA